MCLKFESNSLPQDHPETFTAYKVYLRIGQQLMSPYMPNQLNGTIEHPGTYWTDVPQEVVALFPRYTIHPLIIARRGGKCTTVPLADEFIGWEIDTPGFHVAATKEGADSYCSQLTQELNQRISEVDKKGFQQCRDMAYVVVPVQINKSNVFAVGLTPFGGDPVFPDHEIKTYVTKAITITPETFAEFITIPTWEKFLGFIQDEFHDPEDTQPQQPNTDA